MGRLHHGDAGGKCFQHEQAFGFVIHRRDAEQIDPGQEFEFALTIDLAVIAHMLVMTCAAQSSS